VVSPGPRSGRQTAGSRQADRQTADKRVVSQGSYRWVVWPGPRSGRRGARGSTAPWSAPPCSCPPAAGAGSAAAGRTRCRRTGRCAGPATGRGGRRG
jgi:hypothetical protein